MPTETHDPIPRLPFLQLPGVPEHRHAVWYYFGGLTLFLLMLMVASGLLLSMYYEPSASPAVSPDGTPLAAARVMKDVRWSAGSYRAGEIIVLPLNAATDEVIPYGPLKGGVETLKDPITGRAVRPSGAWVSVEGRIMHDVELGPLVRSIHAYSANLLIAAVLIHMFSAFFMRAYRRRRGIWISGITLLLLILASGFTGYLLPWNQLAYFATRIGVSMPEESLPWLGPAAASALRGGTDVGAATLTRAFSVHAIALPLATLAFTATHLLLVGVFGIDTPAARKRKGGATVAATLGGIAILMLLLQALGGLPSTSPLLLVPLAVLPAVIAYLLSALATSSLLRGPSLPAAEETGRSATSRFIYRDLLCWTITLGIVVTLAVASPWRSGGMPVDLTKPLVTPEGLHPEWYFMFAYQLLRLLPGTVSMLLLLVVGGIWAMVPWLDRSAGKRSLAMTALGIAILVALVALTIGGYQQIGTMRFD